MTETSWPFENADTTEAQFAKWASAIIGSGVVSGLATTVSSGMGLSLAVGTAIVRGVFYENDATKALTVSTAHATQQRKDYLVLRLDLAANSITAVVKAGTPTSGGGTFPALTQNSTTWEIAIAEITVPAAATNLVSGNIATKLAGVGLRVLDYVTTERPTPTELVALGLDKTTKKLELWIGGSWYVLNPDNSWSSLTGKPSTFPPIIGSGAADAVAGNDARLTDARTPTAHNHDDRYFTEAESDARLGGRKYTASASAPSSPATGDLWDELT